MRLGEDEKVETFSEALKKVTALEEFAKKISCSEMTGNLLALRMVIEKHAVHLPVTIKQKKISDYIHSNEK